MNHAGNLVFVFRFYRDAVTAVSLGDHCVLQIGAGTAVYHGDQLGADLVVGLHHGTADLTKGGAGIVCDLILREDAAADFCGQRSQRLQFPEHLIQGVIRHLIIFPAGVSFHPAAGLQQLAHIQQFDHIHGAADLQPFQGAPHICHAGERHAPLLIDPAEGIAGFSLHPADL